ncbi:ABC transporter permease subunit [Clostridium tagluense]|uniref:ABC transporter permease subunit n=1 Tax=Clostridium tagluense TaxID=360422 RepID=UPI001C0D3915|nr:ABC transporter permease subunit [Clostridium tagluense]MBU3128755.1 ABC transporter permease subunit [Clostridium tagluense]
MSKTINKALFYKEWINVKWVTLLTIVILLFYKVHGVISALNENKFTMKRSGYECTSWFNNGLYMRKDSYFFIMIFVVMLLAVILFIGEKNSETQGFIASMPFTRKEIILNKWIVGVLSLLISFVVTYIFLSLFYLANIKGLDTTLNPYSDIVKWLFMDTFQYICIFTFMLLAQSVMGNSIVAGIVGAIIPILPYFIIRLVRILITTHYGFIQYIVMICNKIEDWLNIYSYNLTYQNWSITETNTSWFSYTNYKLKLLILFILTCLFLYLSYVSYKKRNLEYNLRLIVFKNLNPIFICCVSVCSGLLAGYTLGSERLSSFTIWAATFTIIGYFISKVLLKFFSSTK